MNLTLKPHICESRPQWPKGWNAASHICNRVIYVRICMHVWYSYMGSRRALARCYRTRNENAHIQLTKRSQTRYPTSVHNMHCRAQERRSQKHMNSPENFSGSRALGALAQLWRSFGALAPRRRPGGDCCQLVARLPVAQPAPILFTCPDTIYQSLRRD